MIVFLCEAYVFQVKVGGHYALVPGEYSTIKETVEHFGSEKAGN
jgi:hypothetical protein